MNENQNENQNDFKYLTIALNDHGGYEESSPKIFNSIELNCNYNNEDVKTFLISDDLFFVYSVPHDCNHIETEENHIFKFSNMDNSNAQRFVSFINVDACKRAVKNVNIKEMTKNQLIIFFRKFCSFLKQFDSLFEIKNDEENVIMKDILISADINKNKETFNSLKEEIKNLKEEIDIFLSIKETNKKQLIAKELSITNLKILLKKIQIVFEDINVDFIKDENNKEAFRKFMNMLNNILNGTIPYYEYIVTGKHSFYKKEEFNADSYNYRLNPNIDLITTNIGENIGEKKQSFIEVLEYVIREKETNKENQQSNSDCSIEKLQNFINEIKEKSQYSTSELLIVLYIIYEHYERNCFITVNANHCRTCINGGKPRSKTRRKSRRKTIRKIRRNKKAKTKKRKSNKKTKKRKTNKKTNMNRKKSKKRRTKK